MTRSDAMTMRQAKHLVDRMAQGETRRQRKPKHEREEFLNQAEDHLADHLHHDDLLCLACLKPTDCFYLIAGSPEFYMKQLTLLGVPAGETVRLASWTRADNGGMRRASICPSCATLAGMVKMPVSDIAIKLQAAEGAGGEQPVPVAILAESEEKVQDILRKLRAQDQERDKARKKQEEYEMRIKGAQKDVADLMEELEGRGYFTDISNGHIKVYHGEGGPFITTISQTPRNAHRTVLNAKGHIARWERENLNTEPVPAAENDDDEMPRQYTQRTDAEKAALVARYDYADEAAQRELLEKHHIRHRDISRFREYLTEHGWNVSPEPVPLPDEVERTQACETCAKDKALTRENFAQEKVAGKYRWAKKCTACATIKPVTADDEGVIENGHARVAAAQAADIEVKIAPAEPKADLSSADLPMDNSEATRMITLMGRKRDIGARLAVIDTEKAAKVKALEEQMAALTRELDEEKSRLTTERTQVENELLGLISG